MGVLAGSAEVDLFCRVLVGAIFFTAGTAKMFRPRSELRALIRGYRLVPSRLVPCLASSLPWAEVAVAAALVANFMRPVPAIVAAVMLLGFSAAVAVNLARGRRHIPCGCFGSLRPDVGLSWSTVFRNLLLAGLAMRVATTSPTRALTLSEAVPALLLVVAVVLVALLAQAVTRMLRPRTGLARTRGAAAPATSPRTEPGRAGDAAHANEQYPSGLLAIDMGGESAR